MKVRSSARVIIINQEEQVLLLEFTTSKPVDPARPAILSCWATPGGGLEDGETFKEAAMRELSEELGLCDVSLGPLVWTRKKKVYLNGSLVLSNERFYLLKVPSFIPEFKNLTPSEKQVITNWRWWQIAEILQSKEAFAPDDIGKRLSTLVMNMPE